jgi:hypothetical protein
MDGDCVAKRREDAARNAGAGGTSDPARQQRQQNDALRMQIEEAELQKRLDAARGGANGETKSGYSADQLDDLAKSIAEGLKQSFNNK